MADARTLQDEGASQKSSTAVRSQKTVLHYRAASSSVNWTQVANLTDVTGFNGSASMADVTRLDSEGKEKRPGLQDWGQVGIALHIDFKQVSHKALLEAKRAGKPLDFKLTLSDKTTIDFTAYVKDFPVSAKVDQYVSGTVNLEITGDIIVTPGQ